MDIPPDRLQQIEELFHAARELEPGEREALLAAADPEVRREVESLLAQRGDPLLDRPVPGPAASGTTTVMQVAVGTQLGPYRVETLLGRGGMGEVYRAHDTRLNRAVAIKVASHQFTDRFEREARAIAAVNHPHICTLYDVGFNYLVMELVEGETLAARLKKGKLSIEQTLRYGQQIADALAAAHARGITHRDLKPGNIMITKSSIKVLDFGLAKSAQDQTVTATGALMGTPAYMAPEQQDGKECDARTDIYAFGMVLREMATGRRDETNSALPVQLAHVIDRCLVAEPDDRWQTARDLRRELEWAGRRLESSPTKKWKGGSWAAVLTAVVVCAFLASLAVSRFRQPDLSEEPMRLELIAPQNGRFGEGLALSPDGRTIAYVAISGRKASLWLRSLDGRTNRMLAGTDGATEPFWSPDGKSIGFFVQDIIPCRYHWRWACRDLLNPRIAARRELGSPRADFVCRRSERAISGNSVRGNGCPAHGIGSISRGGAPPMAPGVARRPLPLLDAKQHPGKYRYLCRLLRPA